MASLYSYGGEIMLEIPEVAGLPYVTVYAGDSITITGEMIGDPSIGELWVEGNALLSSTPLSRRFINWAPGDNEDGYYCELSGPATYQHVNCIFGITEEGKNIAEQFGVNIVEGWDYDTANTVAEGSNALPGGSATPVFANYDLLNEDGSVFLSASTPVYVGESDGEPTTAEPPTFTTNISGEYTYTQGDTAETLSVLAEVSDGGTITYQWFKDSVVVGTDSSYTPATDEVGTFTYFCRATNTLESGLVATADSNAVTVKVKYDLRSFLTGLIAMLVSTPVRVDAE